MRILCSIVLAGWLATGTLMAAGAPPVNLMPEVSEVQWGESIPVPADGVIILSDQAGTPEREAGRMLAQYTERRFGVKWPVVAAKDAPKDAGMRVFLGQRQDFPALDQLCIEQKIAQPNHKEGYALKVWSSNGKVTAVVAGNSGLGVIYGQDTLFQLLKKASASWLSKKSKVLTVQGATISDWPTIPLRGRPHPHYQYFMKQENFDCVMSSRFNFIDVRDGIYAVEPGAKLKHEELKPIFAKARALGLRVYAVVNCGIPLDQQDACIATFKEFIDMGANGIWLSFDDKGAGADPVRIVERLIALGKEHGITGDAIATTPPKGDYQTVDTKFNRKIVQVPGMEQAVWYWTSIPGSEDAAAGEAIGLKVKPSWWHNWPRAEHPSLSGHGAYVPVPMVSLAIGWNHPSDKELTEMGKYVHSIMPWDGWQAQQHYLVPVLGWWSWRPEKHNLLALRHRIYDTVFGPQNADTMVSFDDILTDVQGRFLFWSTNTVSAPQCPARLKSFDDRNRTIADLNGLKTKLQTIRKQGTAGSVLEPTTLKKEYLDAMEREIETGLAAVRAPYPEYWYPAHQDKILNAIYDNDTAKAEQLIAAVKDRILKEVAQVKELLGKAKSPNEYVAWWEKRANATPDDFRKLIASRQQSLKENIESYNSNVAPFKEMTKNLSDPPIQIGTGIWIRHNHVLASVLPEPRETFWGEWFGGLFEQDGVTVAALAVERRKTVNAGAHVEMPVNIPVSGKRDRLVLMIYVANANKESFGLGRAKWRWSGCRSLRLMQGDKEIWKTDLGIPRLTGEWYVINLPTLPQDMKTLALRLRVEDYWPAKNNLEIAYVGPIHLVELDRD